MDNVAIWAVTDRNGLFTETAKKKGISNTAIVEKDFWVCWTLQKIFSIASLPGPLFKGGTSLSKVYGIIQRFSEDVDIVLDRHTLGFAGAEDPSNVEGTQQA